jgi:protein-L-isoaspartate(D-aspartate) O-methyltransferase
VILFGGALAEIPAAIAGQLGEGGRALAVIRSGAGMGHATLVTRIGGRLAERPVFDAALPLLPGFQPQPGFVF